MAKIKIAVLFGGQSKDYSVSLQSAYSVVTTLSQGNYEVIPIGITRAGRWLYYPGKYDSIIDGSWENDSDCCPAVISPDAVHHGVIKLIDGDSLALQRIDVIFSVIHGKFGECGRIQSLCKLAGIPFLGSNPESSSAMLDKAMTHLILDEAGIKTIKYFCVERTDMPNIDEIIEKNSDNIHYPLFVKAASCSSSIGLNVAFDSSELKAALKMAFSHHHKALVEDALSGRNICCCVYENEGLVTVTGIGELIKLDSAIDDLSNYIGKTSNFVCPADISNEISESIKNTAKRVFRVLDCQGFAIIEFLLNDDVFYCTNAASVPGFTEESIISRLMASDGISYAEMLNIMINNALESKV